MSETGYTWEDAGYLRRTAQQHLGRKTTLHGGPECRPGRPGRDSQVISVLSVLLCKINAPAALISWGLWGGGPVR